VKDSSSRTRNFSISGSQATVSEDTSDVENSIIQLRMVVTLCIFCGFVTQIHSLAPVSLGFVRHLGDAEPGSEGVIVDETGV
jgi:hypothetical protein